jgi:hypothetical protein
MKLKLKIFLMAFGLLLTTGWLSAQTNSPAPSVLSDKSTVDIERAKIEAERNVNLNAQDSKKMMVHDLAWNSWVVFAIAALCFGHLKSRMRFNTIRFLVEKGVPLTPELIESLKNKSRLSVKTKYDGHGYLSWGIILLAAGIGLWFAAGKAGLIVLFVGAANLVLWTVDRMCQKNS